MSFLQELFSSKTKAQKICSFLSINLEKIFASIKPVKDEIIERDGYYLNHERFIKILSPLSPLCANYFDTIEIEVERKGGNIDYIYSKFITTDDTISIKLKKLHTSPSFEELKTFWFKFIAHVSIHNQKDYCSEEYINRIIKQELGGLMWRLNDKGNETNFNTLQKHICDVSLHYYKNLKSCGPYGHFALTIDKYNHLIKVIDNKSNELNTRNWHLKYHSPTIFKDDKKQFLSRNQKLAALLTAMRKVNGTQTPFDKKRDELNKKRNNNEKN